MKDSPAFLWIWIHEVSWSKSGRGGAMAVARTAALQGRTSTPLRPERVDASAAGVLVETSLSEVDDFRPYHHHKLLAWGWRDSMDVGQLCISRSGEDSINLQRAEHRLDLGPGELAELIWNARHGLEDTWIYSQSRVRVLWANNDNASWEKLISGPVKLEHRDLKRLW